jgi:hypothetical protein
MELIGREKSNSIKRKIIVRIKRDVIVQLNYSVDIGRDEGDDGERAKPGVSNGEEDITRNLGSGEVSGC